MKTTEEIEERMKELKKKANTNWKRKDGKTKVKNIYAYGQYFALKWALSDFTVRNTNNEDISNNPPDNIPDNILDIGLVNTEINNLEEVKNDIGSKESI